jgi:hypothetical protein
VKRILLLTSLAVVLSVVGCNRDDSPAPSAQVPAPAPVPTAPATAPTPVDPALANAGLRLNEAKELIDAGKLDEAEAKLKEVAAVKDKLPADQKARFDSYSIVLKAGQNAFKSLNK